MTSFDTNDSSDSLGFMLQDEALLNNLASNIGDAIMNSRLSDGSNLPDLLEKLNVLADLKITIAISNAPSSSVQSDECFQNNKYRFDNQYKYVVCYNPVTHRTYPCP